jgi:hypothetical protein
MLIRHDCGERVPLVYGPTYLDLEITSPGREDVGWEPIISAFESVGCCPHILDHTEWQNPETDFQDIAECVIDTTLDLSCPGKKIVVAGGSIHGLLGGFGTMNMEMLPPDEQRDLRFLGLSVSSFFKPFSYYCENNLVDGDLNTVRDELRHIAGRDTFVADWHKAEVLEGIPFPIVVSPARLIVGGEELPHQRQAYEFLCNLWPRAVGSVVEGVRHDIMHDDYLAAVARETGRLLIEAPLSEPSHVEQARERRKLLLHAFMENYGVSGAADVTDMPMGDLMSRSLAESPDPAHHNSPSSYK